MDMEHWWNGTDGGKPKHSGKILSQCHFVPKPCTRWLLCL